MDTSNLAEVLNRRGLNGQDPEEGLTEFIYSYLEAKGLEQTSAMVREYRHAFLGEAIKLKQDYQPGKS